MLPLCILASLSFGHTFSQQALDVATQESTVLQLTAKDSVVLSSWVIGLGYNIVDDSATPFGQDFMNIKDTWNMLPYPARVSIGRFFKSGIGLEAIGTANRYKVGKKVDGNIIDSPRNYYAIDGKISYDLNKLIGHTGWFDPYLHVGAGYSSIGGVGRSTANAGFGFNTWLSDKWGLNFNTMGKWGLPKGSTKQIQHSAGVVYQFGIEKGLSKKGEEKLLLIDAQEKESQRQLDSIADSNRAREAAALEERLAKEREQAQLAAAEKARIDANNKRRQDLQNEIDALGHLHFNFDSSYLNNAMKGTLDQLALIMTNTPTLTLKISAHTDSRGTDAYNLWLSERRAKSTSEYLVSKGIDSVRLTTEGHGETDLLNECDDHAHCTETKHKVNRRSEFIIIED